jgi:diguanylate cyclase (GGDEF)-like protein
MFDTLTKIYNRHSFEVHFERELLRVKRYGRPLCVALFDIDHFKRFNDTFGHLVGDELLILITQEIGRMIRSTDFFARWGGEEFVLLLSETDATQAHAILEEILLKIANTTHPIAGTVTVSSGMTCVKEKDDAKTVFNRCDEALYRAKNNGRNRIEVSV